MYPRANIIRESERDRGLHRRILVRRQSPLAFPPAMAPPPTSTQAPQAPPPSIVPQISSTQRYINASGEVVVGPRLSSQVKGQTKAANVVMGRVVGSPVGGGMGGGAGGTMGQMVRSTPLHGQLITRAQIPCQVNIIRPLSGQYMATGQNIAPALGMPTMVVNAPQKVTNQ